MAMTEPLPVQQQEVGAKLCPCWVYAALAVALAGTAGSLLLTWSMGLVACPLCFYQRVFMMGCLGALLVGMLTPDLKPGRASLFALPCAMGGFAVAIFHVNLELSGKLECPAGMFDVATAPRQSLGVFFLLLLLLGGDLVQARKAGQGIPLIGLGAGLLGLLFAVGLIFSGPPLPVYTESPEFQKKYKYDKSPVECRPPKPGTSPVGLVTDSSATGKAPCPIR